MGEIDYDRQFFNVLRSKISGAEFIKVKSGTKTLKDAVNEALRYWISNLSSTHYIIGSTVGPSPFPEMVKTFQSIISMEMRQELVRLGENLNELKIIGCVGGGSNFLGGIYHFIEDENVELIAIEAAGDGADKHSMALGKGREGVLHGALSLLIQSEDGQVEETFSISSGLDYPSVGPELVYLKDIGRIRVESCDDKSALNWFLKLSRFGIIPALESSHALHGLDILKKNDEINADTVICIILSGEGSKDLDIVSKYINY